MTPERWQQINQVFDEAFEQPAAERAAFLTRVCAGDEELRRRVEAMLAADAQADLLLDRPAQAVAAELLSAETSSTHESEILSGHTIGSYRLLREIGRGGMGKVYLARDERLDRRVALKLLPAGLTDDADRVARFQREARAASALNHPNILTIYDFGQDADQHYIAAELVEGRTLRALIGQPGCTLNQALDIAIQIASALAAAHAAGIVHRDIKPENVMLRTDGFVKVLDFGLAKLTELKARDWDILRTSDGETGKPTLPLSHSPILTWATRPGILMGTVAYMSPEQARGLEVDARSDLFSLGVVLYEMLTGERPFTGETPTDVLAALIEREPPALPFGLLPEKADAAVRAELQRVVSRALAKPLDKRYQTAGEMLDELKRLRQELEFATKLRGDSAAKALRARTEAGQATPADLPTSPAGQATARPDARPIFRLSYLRRHRRLAVLALVTLVLLTVGGALAARWLIKRNSALNSIAVLPFVNVGNDSQMEYLSDGLTESLIGSLSQLPSLSVMARNTVFTYKGREVDPRLVGADLKVRAVVTGRVLRQGERLLIRAELVDTANGARLWGDEYERPLADLLTLERELTREISEALRPRLRSNEQRQLTSRQSANSEAYRLYLLGRHFWSQGTRATQEKALTYYNQAIALDPGYALAYAGIANVYAVSSSQYLPPSEAIPKARQAALTALRLDETLPEAHHALALVKFFGDWDWAGAEHEYKRALELNPSFVYGYAAYANLLAHQGRYEEALRAANRAQALDPLSSNASFSLGQIFYFARQYDRALVYFQKIVDLGQNTGGGHLQLGRTLSQQGKHQQAISELRQAFALNQQHTFRSWLAYGYARAGQRDEAWQLLRELEAVAKQDWVSPVHLARIYIALGDKDRAFDWLRKAYAEHSEYLLSLGQEPVYDPLRSDPRFTEMMRGIGLTP